MKTEKFILEKAKKKLVKVFQPLTNQQLESVVGGPVSSRGTETNVQQGT
ncbi:hypothetical protein ACFSJW_16855 [Flavobacterium artemisiae]|uniref:Bacteriocin-type signal sequence-containing protein n=1 Tax=Flavobacterium artemisiae TaxID=2126556 RepID=A0ABW4H8X2_9FLAO